MNFGTIGAGTVAQAIARHLVTTDNQVILSNSRGPDTLGDVVDALGPLASSGTVAQAASADMVFLAVRWSDIPDALSGLPAWNERILVDTSNLGPGSRSDGFVDLGSSTGSEFVAEHAPGARIVKAFNTLYAKYIAADPRHAEGRQLLVYAGDDTDAKAQLHQVTDSFGFAPVDLGSLRDGGRLMEVGGGPFSALHALKQD
jgi:predicted dinucleotide-binding enzyme